MYRHLVNEIVTSPKFGGMARGPFFVADLESIPPNSGAQHRPYLKQVFSNSSSGFTARKGRVVNETMTSVYTNNRTCYTYG